MHHRYPRPHAFSLIELAVVLIVVAVIAAIAVPTFSQVIRESDFRAHQARDEALARRIGAGIAFRTQPTYADIVAEALTETDVSGRAPTVTAQSTGWNPTVNFIPTDDPDDPDNEANWVTLAAGDDANGDPWTADRYQLAWTVDATALRTATRHDATRVVYCSVLLANGLGICTDGVPSAPSGPSPGFPLTVDTERDAALDLSWPTQDPATSYRLTCWTPALTPAGDTPKIVPAVPGSTQTASATGLENLVEHTCEVDAIVTPADVTSAPATGTPFRGSALPPGDPIPRPPVGDEPDPPPTPTPPTPTECLATATAECLSNGATLAGLASFASAHAGNHQLYTVDTAANRLRVVVDTNTSTSATRTIEVRDAAGTTVDLTATTDLVAGRHPSRSHPQGTSPYSVFYAATSTGTVWMLSPISGSSVWRGYQVASGLGSISSIAYDACPATPASSTRAGGDTMCVHAATAAGVVPVPMTATGAPVIETPMPPRGPAGSGVASNTADGLGGTGPGAYFTTSGATVTRTNWDGTANALTNSGPAMTSGAGIAWMDGNFYVADLGSRRVFQVTPAGVRTVVAGSGTNHIADGTGTGASFSAPTSIHWHGSTPNVYVLDTNCVRRLNTTTGAVTTLLCPATRTTAELTRVDVAQSTQVASPSTVTVTANSSTASAVIPGAFSLTAELAHDSDWVVFDTTRSDLGPADTNGTYDVYRRNLSTGEVQRVTDGTNGAPNGGFQPRTSADGNTIAYLSTNSRVLYVTTYTGATAATVTAYTGSSSSEAAGLGDITQDGTEVAFTTLRAVTAGDTNNARDVFVYSITTGTTTRVSTNSTGGQSGPNNTGDCSGAQFSPDGTKVAFACNLTQLVAADSNGRWDVFVKNLSTGAIVRASLSAAGAEGNNDSGLPAGDRLFTADGNQLMFTSSATNLVSGDTNGAVDVFTKDLTSGAITRITRADGTELAAGSYVATFSPDNSNVAFATADNLGEPGANTTSHDVFLKPATGSGTYRLLSMTNSGTGGGWITGAASQYTISLGDDRVAYHLRYPTDGNNRFLATRLL